MTYEMGPGITEPPDNWDPSHPLADPQGFTPILPSGVELDDPDAPEDAAAAAVLEPDVLTALADVAYDRIRLVRLDPPGAADRPARRRDDPAGFGWSGARDDTEARILHDLADCGAITDDLDERPRLTEAGARLLLAANRDRITATGNRRDTFRSLAGQITGSIDPNEEREPVDRAAALLQDVTGHEAPGVTYAAGAVWVDADVLTQLLTLAGKPAQTWPALTTAADALLARLTVLLAGWPTDTSNVTRGQREAAWAARRAVHAARQALASADTRGTTSSAPARAAARPSPVTVVSTTLYGRSTDAPSWRRLAMSIADALSLNEYTVQLDNVQSRVLELLIRLDVEGVDLTDPTALARRIIADLTDAGLLDLTDPAGRP